MYDRLIELHEKKGWLKEITINAITLLLSKIIVYELGKQIISKIFDLFLNLNIQELAAWQIMLLIELQLISNRDCYSVSIDKSHHKNVKKINGKIQKTLNEKNLNFSVNKKIIFNNEHDQTDIKVYNLNDIEATLLVVASEYPKVFFCYYYYN
jgi:hypothetical protein